MLDTKSRIHSPESRIRTLCGGFKATINDISEKDLEKFYSPEQIKYLKKKGVIEGHFWDPRPVLPAVVKGQKRLFDWGSRDKEAPFPVTGWAKKESVDAGKWKYLKPEKVAIPIEEGYEKKVWFDMPEGTEGLLIEKEGDERVYMVTEKADPKFKKETSHLRMPVGKKEKFRK